MRLLLYIAILLTLTSCSGSSDKDEGTQRYYQFLKQITPSGEFIIYKYARYGELAFSSDISSTELFPANERFREGEGKKIRGTISHWINKDTLLVYDFKSDLQQPKDTLPISIRYSDMGDFIIKTVQYKTNSGGTNTFLFDSVWTDSETISIRFYSNPKKRDVRTFPLGSVCIQSTSDSILLIEVFGGVSKSMDFVYNNPDGTTSKNLPHVSTTYYKYAPVRKISPVRLNKQKIFWEE